MKRTGRLASRRRSTGGRKKAVLEKREVTVGERDAGSVRESVQDLWNSSDSVISDTHDASEDSAPLKGFSQRAIVLLQKLHALVCNRIDGVTSEEAGQCKEILSELCVLARKESSKAVILRSVSDILVCVFRRHRLHSESLQRACDLIWSLAYHNPEAQSLFSQNVNLALIESVKQHATDWKVLKSAFGAMSSLCRHAVNQDVVKNGGFLDLILKVLQQGKNIMDETLVQYTLDCTASVCHSHKENGNYILANDGARFVVDILEIHMTKQALVRSACIVLVVLRDRVRGPEAISESKCALVLVNVIQKHEANEELVHILSALLGQLLLEVPKMKQELLESCEGVKTISGALQRHFDHNFIVEAACMILNSCFTTVLRNDRIGCEKAHMLRAWDAVLKVLQTRNSRPAAYVSCLRLLSQACQILGNEAFVRSRLCESSMTLWKPCGFLESPFITQYISLLEGFIISNPAMKILVQICQASLALRLRNAKVQSLSASEYLAAFPNIFMDEEMKAHVILKTWDKALPCLLEVDDVQSSCEGALLHLKSLAGERGELNQSNQRRVCSQVQSIFSIVGALLLKREKTHRSSGVLLEENHLWSDLLAEALSWLQLLIGTPHFFDDTEFKLEFAILAVLQFTAVSLHMERQATLRSMASSGGVTLILQSQKAITSRVDGEGLRSRILVIAAQHSVLLLQMVGSGDKIIELLMPEGIEIEEATKEALHFFRETSLEIEKADQEKKQNDEVDEAEKVEEEKDENQDDDSDADESVNELEEEGLPNSPIREEWENGEKVEEEEDQKERFGETDSMDDGAVEREKEENSSKGHKFFAVLPTFDIQHDLRSPTEPLIPIHQRVGIEVVQALVNFQIYEEKTLVYDWRRAGGEGIGLAQSSLPPLVPYSTTSQVPLQRPDVAILSSSFVPMMLNEHSLLFESRFEGGNLLNAVRTGPQQYDLMIRSDLHTQSHHQWFYFAVANTHPTGCQGREDYVFNIVNLTKPASMFSHGMQPVVYSMEDGSWKRSGSNISYFANTHFMKPLAPDSRKKKALGTFSTLSFTLSFEKRTDDRYLVAMCFPYTFSQLQQFLERECSNPAICRRTLLCKSISGLRCDELTITNFTSPASEIASRPAVIFTARVHPGEVVASYMMEGTVQFLLGRSALAKTLRSLFYFKIVPMLNPDGVMFGNSRTSLAGCDLNRTWSAPNPKLYPIIHDTKLLIKRMMAQRKVVLYVDFHGHSRKKNIFMYGVDPKKPPSTGEVRKFPRLLAESRYTRDIFSLPDCSFNVKKGHSSAARVVVARELGIKTSYTLEASFCGAGIGTLENKMREIHFNTHHYRRMGQGLGDALLRLEHPEVVEGLEEACSNGDIAHETLSTTRIESILTQNLQSTPRHEDLSLSSSATTSITSFSHDEPTNTKKPTTLLPQLIINNNNNIKKNK